MLTDIYQHILIYSNLLFYRGFSYCQAQSEYDRVKDVYEKKLVAKSALDKASADLKAARPEKALADVGRCHGSYRSLGVITGGKFSGAQDAAL